MSHDKDDKPPTGPTRIGFGRPAGQPPSATAPTHPVEAAVPAAPRSASASSGRSSGSVPWLEAGVMLGKYRIVGRLGSGGMGAVYEAVNADIAKPVALKTLSPSLAADERARARFLREAATATRLDHPAVVNVIDYG